MTNSILVAGEALIDLVVETDDALHAHPGGGPFNTARTLGRLERPVAFLGRVSADRFGRRLEGLLERDGVRLDSLVRTPDPTTLALAELDPAGVAGYRFYTQGTAAPGLTPEAALAAVPADLGILHIGTLGVTLEPIATAMEAVVAGVGEQTLVALDVNCRPWVIENPRVYRERLGRLLARTDVVKVSEEDLAWLHPDRTPIEAVRALLHQGPELGLLTRGPGGAVVVTRTAEVTVPAPATKVVDTIGAGDAFGGAFIAWWHAHGMARDDLGLIDTAVEATVFACLVAARTCARAGASPPHLDEVSAALGRVA